MKTTYAHQSNEDKKAMRKLIAAPTVTIQDNQVLAKAQEKQEKLDEEITPVEDAESKIEPEKEKEAPFKSNNIGWKRVFTYYKPTWFVVVMLFTAFLGSFGFPSMGFFLSELQFIYYGGENDPEGEWVQERNSMLWKFAVALFAISTVFGFNNSSFGWMGEKLTFYLRLELYEETLHK